MQVDSSKFVQRKGMRLVLNGQTYKFAGASNYYMLTRAVEKVTRPQVLLMTPAGDFVLSCSCHAGMRNAKNILFHITTQQS